MTFMLQPTVPPFRQIASALRQAIRTGELGPGSELPSLPELAARYGGVSRQTVQQALRVLAAEGLIVTRRGARTIVQSPSVRFRASGRERHGRARRDRSRLSHVLDQEMTSVGRAPATEEVAAIFGVDEGTDMICRRLVLREPQSGHPVGVGQTWVVASEFAGTPVDTHHGVLDPPFWYQVEQITGRRYAVELDRIEAGFPNAEDALALRIPPETPILRLLRTCMDSDRRVLEVTIETWPYTRIFVEDEYDISASAPIPVDPSEA
jgi:GntR family transcriptional regulator